MEIVKCNKCEYIAPESEFPKGNDFFQNSYIKSCPKCNNQQNPGNASMRAFDNKRPFIYIREPEPPLTGTKTKDALPITLHRASEAS